MDVQKLVMITHYIEIIKNQKFSICNQVSKILC